MEKLTGYLFDVESPNFTLRNVMEVPLLKYKDDVEVHVVYKFSFAVWILHFIPSFFGGC